MPRPVSPTPPARAWPAPEGDALPSRSASAPAPPTPPTPSAGGVQPERGPTEAIPAGRTARTLDDLRARTEAPHAADDGLDIRALSSHALRELVPERFHGGTLEITVPVAGMVALPLGRERLELFFPRDSVLRVNTRLVPGSDGPAIGELDVRFENAAGRVLDGIEVRNPSALLEARPGGARIADALTTVLVRGVQVDSDGRVSLDAALRLENPIPFLPRPRLELEPLARVLGPRLNTSLYDLLEGRVYRSGAGPLAQPQPIALNSLVQALSGSVGEARVKASLAGHSGVLRLSKEGITVEGHDVAIHAHLDGHLSIGNKGTIDTRIAGRGQAGPIEASFALQGQASTRERVRGDFRGTLDARATKDIPVVTERSSSPLPRGEGRIVVDPDELDDEMAQVLAALRSGQISLPGWLPRAAVRLLSWFEPELPDDFRGELGGRVAARGELEFEERSPGRVVANGFADIDVDLETEGAQGRKRWEDGEVDIDGRLAFHHSRHLSANDLQVITKGTADVGGVDFDVTSRATVDLDRDGLKLERGRVDLD